MNASPRKPRSGFLTIMLLGLLAAAFASGTATARGTKAENIYRSNKGVVGVISGAYGETYLRIASELAAVLNEEDGLRVLPIAGLGSLQNIDDILHLKGVDVGIVQSDVLAHIRQNRLHARISERINYIAKLFNQEFHIIAGPQIRTLQDLQGQKVSIGVKGSGTFITASAVFGTLGVEIAEVHFDTALALDKIRNGEIAAAAVVTGRPADAFRALDGRDGLHLLAVPYAKPLREAYLPARFTHLDYPGIIPKGANVPTISVDTVMAVYNWEPGSVRYTRVLRFIKAFFSKFEALKQPPRHRKWREMALAAEVPGWQRFPPVNAILKKQMQMRRAAAGKVSSTEQ